MNKTTQRTIADLAGERSSVSTLFQQPQSAKDWKQYVP